VIYKLQAIESSLGGKECSLNFRPLRIASESDEKIKAMIVSGNGNGILKALVHVLRTAYVQWVKKLSQCLALLKRLTCQKSSKLCNNVKIIYLLIYNSPITLGRCGLDNNFSQHAL